MARKTVRIGDNKSGVEKKRSREMSRKDQGKMKMESRSRKEIEE